MTQITIPYNYKPYPFQIDLLKARDQGALLMLTRWHRRAGKDKTFWNMTIKEAAKRKGQYYYLFPEYKQGRRVIWDGMDNDGFSFLDHIPPELRGGTPNQQEMKIKLSNGSIIQIIGTDDYDKIRGSNPVGMVFSEYAYQNPAAYDVASPILLRNGGWAAFNSCVVADTLILGKNGFERIGRPYGVGYTEIQEDFYGLNNEFHTASHYYYAGKRETIKITTKSGYSIEGTPEHPLWDGNKFIRLDRWAIGNSIPIQRNQQVFGSLNSWNIPEYSGNFNIEFLSRDFNEDLMYELGLILGDGYINFNNGTVNITSFDEETEAFLLSIGYKECKSNPNHYEKYSKVFCDFLKWFGFKQSIAKTKQIPKKVLSLTKELQAAFISGYFDSDGSSDKRGRHIIASASEDLISDLQVLLLNYGIISGKSVRATPPTKKVKVESIQYRLEISGYNAWLFYKQIGYRLTRKQERMGTVSKRAREYWNDKVEVDKDILFDECKKTGDYYIRYQNNGSISYNKLKNLATNKFDKVLEDNFYYDEVANIEYGEDFVYDFTIPDTHSFFSNGLISSNTPFGKNHMYDMEMMLRDDPDAFVQVCTIDDTFDWDGTPLLTNSDLDKERKRGKTEEFLQQEYYCFQGDTDIICQDEVKKIKDIKEGDFVLTHSNRFRKVLKTFKREYYGSSIRIKTTGSNKDLYCTPNHPFRVCNDGKNYIWKEAKDLTLKDRLVLPRLREKKLQHISSNLVIILGWYITKGCCSKQAVQFTLNIDEKEYIEEIQKALLTEYGLKSKVYKNVKNNSATVIVNSIELAEFLANHCGSKNKKLPLDLISGYEKEIYNILLRGDGCIVYDKYREIYTTVSKTLAYQVQLLSNMLGNRAVLREIKQDDYGTMLDQVVELSTKYEVISYPKSRSDAIKNHKYNCSVKIREIEEQVYEDNYVYNFEVQYDNSYVANSRVVHNCDYTANAEGFYYLNQMEDLRASNRIGDFPWNPEHPVYTYWDIGVYDSTAIWFVQMYNDTVWIIDYYRANSAGMDHYAHVLQNKSYVYKTHMFPHDIKNTEFGTGKTRLEIAENMFGSDKVEWGPKLGFEDGVQAARILLPKCKFNEELCKEGIKALENYHREWDDTRQEFKQKPAHDWSSHPADAFRYLAVGLVYPQEKKKLHDKLRSYRRKYGRKSWLLA